MLKIILATVMLTLAASSAQATSRAIYSTANGGGLLNADNGMTADNMTVNGTPLGEQLEAFPAGNITLPADRDVTLSTDTILSSDEAKTVVLKNPSGVAVTLPAATATGFGQGFGFSLSNRGGESNLFSVSRIDNVATPLSIRQNDDCDIRSNGTHYATSHCPIWSYNPTFSTGVMTTADNRLTLTNTSTIQCRYIDSSKNVAYTTAGACAGRIGYDVSSGVNKGIMIEPSRTTMILNSDISVATASNGWTSNGTGTVSGTTTINGKTVPVLSMAGTYATKYTALTNRLTLTAGHTYTCGTTVKWVSGTAGDVSLQGEGNHWGSGTVANLKFNPQACTFSSATAASIGSNYTVGANGDGCSVSWTATAFDTFSTAVVSVGSHSSSITGTMGVDAVQCVEATTLTTPIDTAGANVMRAEDSVSLTNPYWFNNTSGTLRQEFYLLANTASGQILSDSTLDRAPLYINGSNFGSKDGTNTVDYLLAVPTAGTKIKVCLRYGNGKSNVCANGSCGTEQDFDGSWNITGFKWFRDYADANKLYGNAPQNMYWDSRIYTDAECDAWTTP